MLDFLGNLERTHTCGELRAEDAGKSVVLLGWVNRRRDHGNLIFLDLRDRYGISQVVLDKDLSPAGHAKAEQARSEYVVAAIGKVRVRGKDAINPKMATGEIEIVADEIRILNDTKVPPFSPAEDAIGNEEVRLKYRYLDLRRAEMQRNFEVRHKVSFAVRQYLSDQNFFEVETPLMTRSTPEGARDYLVPSRVHPGSFYALPQSPQLFKQILMISGFDRYFQIARCFRDEDFRADRQAEFTQIDLEMTFPQQKTIFRIVEGFLSAAFTAVGISLPVPFPQITYDEAMRQFGIDKPDLRLPGLTDVKAAFADGDLATLAIDPALPVVALRIPKVGELSRKERDDNKPLFDTRKGAKYIDDLKRLEKSFPDAVVKLRKLAKAEDGDLLIIIAGDAASHIQASDTKSAGRLSEREIAVYSAAGNFRVELAKKYADRHGAFAVTEQVVASPERNSGLADGSAAFRPIWVTDFPMFEHDPETGKWMPAHHPFTSPHEEDMDRLVSDPAAVRARYYDLAMNGLELGSGSIRIHRQDVQQQIFRALGMSDEEAKSRFGFFLEALQYGTPPHGGIALGLDRLVMILAGASSLREVIAFPKTAKAIDLMVDAPTPVSDAQLKELHIKTVLKS
ncbi:aspartate--tRNA ligase [Alloacidobacterium dinghuense]|uniref:Aspartate--tRNA(Asp/Asn) ligase n=1 Tax=Alloacidobacterium dinghuense TaxID=2763107 RepID=A0A7G8BH95_9BACT|nr:aspartate--tRNA ligase [Alloacidobacterium dinghuense]QNI31915.1 aspartate--tRNA ligase [Alloacidobacterium dinghuense]